MSQTTTTLPMMNHKKLYEATYEILKNAYTKTRTDVTYLKNASSTRLF